MHKDVFGSRACDAGVVHSGKWSDDFPGRSERLSDAEVCIYSREKVQWKAERPAI